MYSDTLELLTKARQSGIPVVLVTHLDSGEQTLCYREDEGRSAGLTDVQREQARKVLQTDRCRVVLDNGEKLFFQPFNPPLHLIVVGAVHITQALIVLARLCGFRVTLVDPRRAFATEQRFPGVNIMTEWPDDALRVLAPDSRTAVVTLTHDPKIDDPALEMALRSSAFYIGALGSRKTQQARLKRLAAAGLHPRQCTRIRGPVGLAIGAQSAGEIAVSIMAQIIQTLRNEQGDAV
jgi:xanthine dehydrogenase accessory factor